MILIVKLFLAHILGDFFLQPTKWVKDKEKKVAKSKYLYWHIGIHFALVWLILFDLSAWKIALIIAATHGVIDYLKLKYQTKKNKQKLFIYDQIAHLVILIVIGYYYSSEFHLASSNYILNYGIIYITAVLFITQPSALLIKNLISVWAPEKEKKKDKSSLQNAGFYIGILERLFVLYFVISHNITAIGFILAAKSIFRFGDLTATKDRKLTEYVLIGTLLSFGFALLTGLVVNLLLRLI